MVSKLNLLAYALCIAIHLSSALGAYSAGFGVSGAILKAEVLPGEEIRHQMVVMIADDGSPLELVAEVVGFGQTLDGEPVRLESEDDTSPHSARDFLRVSPERFKVKTGSSESLLLNGEIPRDGWAGGRYALIEIRSLPPGYGPFGIAFAIYVPIFLTISGTELVETGEITGLEVEEMDGPSVDLMASLTFKNTGNHHYRARAGAVLKDGLGNVLASGETPLEESSIIPEALRLFEISLGGADDLPSGAFLEARVISEDGRTLDSDEIALAGEGSWR
ncbi:MAG TPA: hypothetical protein PLX30_00735 [Methanothrix sp.]|nr:hypothetical protein [Methanothrix sp.]